MSYSTALLHLVNRGKLPVFLFHKIPIIADPMRPGDLDLYGFNRVLDYISERFKVIPLDDAVAKLQTGTLPPNAACITFDDGYEGWVEGAASVLEKRNLHATFFITSGQFDGFPMWHERIAYAVNKATKPYLTLTGFGLPKMPVATPQQKIHTSARIEAFLKYQRLSIRDELLLQLESEVNSLSSDVPKMNVADLRTLQSRGFAIGAHTVEHPILTLCDPQQALAEISQVKEQLEGMINARIHSFAYPNGRPVTDFNADHVRLAKRAGYSYAVTTQSGRADRHTDIFQIPRFTPWGPTARNMDLQIARNFLSAPRQLSYSADKVPAPGSQTKKNEAPVKILLVENGAGFGGAVIALQTLLAEFSADRVQCDVVSNLPVADFSKFSAVRSHRVIADRIFDSKNLSQAITRKDWGISKSFLLFIVGRLDDLLNRTPYLLRLALQVLKVKPDLVHGNNEPNSNREAMLIAKLFGIPYVQHLRGALTISKHSPWLLTQPDFFIPVSRWLAGDLLEAKVPAEKIRQIYDAVDLTMHRSTGQAGSLRESLKIPASTVLVAMLGMLVGWKGQQVFIDAVRQMPKTAKNVVYLVIGGLPARGDENYEKALHEQVRNAGLSESIIFLGRRDDIPAILPELNVIVSASTEPEPLGLVMLEAMASGAIFIAPAFGAAIEVVKDGWNGFLFEPKSSSSLASKLTLALNMQGTEQQLKKNAQSSVVERFSTLTCAKATEAIYRTLSQGRKNQAANA